MSKISFLSILGTIIVGLKRISLLFDKNKYYEGKVTVNTDFIKQKYMRGIYENPSLFNGHIFSYDESAYAVEISTTLKEKATQATCLHYI